MRILMKFILTVGGALLMMTADLSAQPPDTTGTRVTLRVDGLSCMFCAYGLEKKLNSFEGTSDLQIRVDEGVARFDVEQGVTITDEQLRKAVEDAGFTLRTIKRQSLTALLKRREKSEVKHE